MYLIRLDLSFILPRVVRYFCNSYYDARKYLLRADLVGPLVLLDFFELMWRDVTWRDARRKRWDTILFEVLFMVHAHVEQLWRRRVLLIVYQVNIFWVFGGQVGSSERTARTSGGWRCCASRGETQETRCNFCSRQNETGVGGVRRVDKSSNEQTGEKSAGMARDDEREREKVCN